MPGGCFPHSARICGTPSASFVGLRGSPSRPSPCSRSGLGANTAIFSVVEALLLRPLPFREPDRLAALFEKNIVGEQGFNSVSPGAYFDWREQASSFEHVAAYAVGPFTIAPRTVSRRSGWTARW